MAITATLVSETWRGSKRSKIYSLLHDGSATTITFTPGLPFAGSVIGGYTSRSAVGTAGTITLTVVAGGTGLYSYVECIQI
jgi:hypothetical protein